MKKKGKPNKKRKKRQTLNAITVAICLLNDDESFKTLTYLLADYFSDTIDTSWFLRELKQLKQKAIEQVLMGG